MLVLMKAKGGFYFGKTAPSGIWGVALELSTMTAPDEADIWCKTRRIPVKLESQAVRRHTFSHFHLDYTPLVGHAKQPVGVGEARPDWLKAEKTTALPAPVRRLIQELAPNPA